MFSRLDLHDRRVLITGASSGIGRALALTLATQRTKLVLASRDQLRLEQLAGEVRARGSQALVVPADLTDGAQRANLIRQATEAFGGLDLLINNAGVGAMGFFAEVSEQLLRRIFEVNFFATTELTRLALPLLRQGRDAMIVNIASVLGRRAVAGCTDYCASKFAVVGWSEGLRAELAAEGIHVLVVCPGTIQTAFRENLLEARIRFGYYRRKRMSAERCAALIVRAIRSRRHEVVITSRAKALLWLNWMWPWLLDVVLARYARSSERKEEH